MSTVTLMTNQRPLKVLVVDDDPDDVDVGDCGSSLGYRRPGLVVAAFVLGVIIIVVINVAVIIIIIVIVVITIFAMTLAINDCQSIHPSISQ